ncbi:hypothetical protein ACNTMW_30890 [Planosporangium sp. 12N6]|uniref:hypothetical protein n=1 Tax=Planosporangium spinosum TaxID=3402278 RepID=UPI003CEDEFDB
MLRLPSTGRLPDGPHRSFVEEFFMHYREAGRPPLRVIATWIQVNADSRDLPGTASTETIRRVLTGVSVPRTWLTVETILEALCGIAGRSTGEERWPEDNSSATFKDALKERWNAALDHYEADLPTLPPRPSPISASAPSSQFGDPWASVQPARSPFDDEPLF